MELNRERDAEAGQTQPEGRRVARELDLLTRDLEQMTQRLEQRIRKVSAELEARERPPPAASRGRRGRGARLRRSPAKTRSGP